MRCGKSWLKTRHATRTQKLPLLDVGILKSSMLCRNSQYNEPGFLNPDFHVEDAFVLFIPCVLCVFFLVGPTVTVLHAFFVGSPCFCWQREREKKHTNPPPTSRGFFKKKRTADVPGTNEGEKTPKLGNIRINEVRR